MSYKTVRHAQNAVWPTVRESLRLHQASRAAAWEGKKLSRMEERDAKKSWNRVVSEETVWAIARSDLLASPEEAAVLAAAKQWLRDVGPEMIEYPEEFGFADRKLRDAVQALATSFDPPDDEALHLSPESATVGPTNH